MQVETCEVVRGGAEFLTLIEKAKALGSNGIE
jgi:hypothetical protein